MFEELYAPLPDSGKYLERIGNPKVTGPNLETLDALILAQQRSVPFENLDVYDAGADISLEITQLYDKIVTRRRGGYCFELNSLFYSLLKSLGFDCHPVAARVVWFAQGVMPISHRATVVTIGGVRYFCDVGFGGPSPNRALKLDTEEPQSCGANTFKFEKKDGKNFIIYRLTDTGKEQLLMFSDEPYEPVDFLAFNEYQSKNKNSGFKRMRMLNLSTADGAISLNDRTLRIHKNGEVTETVLDTEDKLRQAIKEHYGITVDFPLKSNS
jgi:N-hydroxyarylamine O-acetyltransferase